MFLSAVLLVAVGVVLGASHALPEGDRPPGTVSRPQSGTPDAPFVNIDKYYPTLQESIDEYNRLNPNRTIKNPEPSERVRRAERPPYLPRPTRRPVSVRRWRRSDEEEVPEPDDTHYPTLEESIAEYNRYRTTENPESSKRARRAERPPYLPRPTMRPVPLRRWRRSDGEEVPEPDDIHYPTLEESVAEYNRFRTTEKQETLERIRRAERPPYLPRPTSRPNYNRGRRSLLPQQEQQEQENSEIVSSPALTQQMPETLDRVRRAERPPYLPRPRPRPRPQQPIRPIRPIRPVHRNRRSEISE